jgi:hypothetical protein
MADQAQVVPQVRFFIKCYVKVADSMGYWVQPHACGGFVAHREALYTKFNLCDVRRHRERVQSTTAVLYVVWHAFR